MRIFLCFILLSAILTSCSSSSSLIKRKYRSGYYFNRSDHRESNARPSQADPGVPEAENDTIHSPVTVAELPAADQLPVERVEQQKQTAVPPDQPPIFPEEVLHDTTQQVKTAEKKDEHSHAAQPAAAYTDAQLILIVLGLILGTFAAFAVVAVMAVFISGSGGLNTAGTITLIVGALLIALTDILILRRVIKKQKAQKGETQQQQ